MKKKKKNSLILELLGALKKKWKEPNLKCWHKINQNQVPKFAKQVDQIDLYVITQQQKNWKKEPKFGATWASRKTKRAKN